MVSCVLSLAVDLLAQRRPGLAAAQQAE